MVFKDRISNFPLSVKRKRVAQCKKEREPPGFPFQLAGLLSAEGHAVGALFHGGIAFVGAHQNLVQGAVVFALAVVGALADGALHTFVGMAVHIFSLLLLGSQIV